MDDLFQYNRKLDDISIWGFLWGYGNFNTSEYTGFYEKRKSGCRCGWSMKEVNDDNSKRTYCDAPKM
jgi:hypothetical protein